VEVLDSVEGLDDAPSEFVGAATKGVSEEIYVSGGLVEGIGDLLVCGVGEPGDEMSYDSAYNGSGHRRAALVTCSFPVPPELSEGVSG